MEFSIEALLEATAGMVQQALGPDVTVSKQPATWPPTPDYEKPAALSAMVRWIAATPDQDNELLVNHAVDVYVHHRQFFTAYAASETVNAYIEAHKDEYRDVAISPNLVEYLGSQEETLQDALVVKSAWTFTDDRR